MKLTRTAGLNALVLGALMMALVGGCSSPPAVTTVPAPIKCSVAVTPPTVLDAGAGTGSLTVTAPAECAWTAEEQASWISSLSPTSGQGNATVQFQVTANSAPSVRQADITINGIIVRVTQSGTVCAVELSPTSQTIPAGGGSGAVDVTTPAGCPWTATTGESWVTITSGASGSASGTVGFSVTPNAGSARVGLLMIGGQAFAVTQPAPTAVPCTNIITPASQSLPAAAGTTTVTIEADPSCSWTAASNAPWLAVVGVGLGSGNGAVSISATANTGTARIGTASIAGQTFTVTQAGSCATSLSPTSAAVGVAGATGLSVTVTTAVGCAWTATRSDTWMSITAGASGSGNGTFTYNVAANTGAARTGTITVGGQVHTITQAAPCAYSISPTSQSAPATAGAGTAVAVTAGPGCAWTASTSATWMTITGGASGSGNGSVTFTMVANPASARVGTITIAGQTHTVNQAGSCLSTLSPASQLVASSSGAGTPIAVTSPAGCAWTATTVATWISITSGASGTGNGTVAFTAAENLGPLRTGAIAIAGQTHTVTQASGCVYSISPTIQTFNRNVNSSAPIAVTTTAGCSWTAVSHDSWITVAAGPSGTGPGTVFFTITENTTGATRTGTLTIAGRTFTVSQND